MGEDVENVAQFRIDDRQPVNLIKDERANSLKEAGIWTDPHQLLGVVELTFRIERRLTG